MKLEYLRHKMNVKLINFTKKLGLYTHLRNIYHKKFAYYSLNPKWDLKNKIVKINFHGGILKFKLTNEKKKYYDRPIYKCEPLGFLTNELKGYLKNFFPKKVEGISIDIGAYQGAFPIYLRKIQENQDKIICFEPIKENYEILEKNLNLNKVSNVEIIKKGVWNKKDKVLFENEGETSSISKEGNSLLDVVDLDSELKRLKISPKKIKFVKMDIEGAEIEVIEGMQNLLKEGSPFLAIASYHLRDGEQTYKEVEKRLRALGYKTKTGYPKHLTTWAWKRYS